LIIAKYLTPNSCAKLGKEVKGEAFVQLMINTNYIDELINFS